MSPAETHPRRWVVGGWVAVAIVYTVSCLDLVNIQVDDVFITLRFADNMLAGNGAVFNTGDYVEGYSNPTWLMLLATLGGITGTAGDVQFFYLSKVLSFVFGALTLVVLYRLSKSRGNSEFVTLLLLLTVASSVFLNTYSASGMETSLVTFLLVSTFLLYFRWEDERTRRYACSFAVVLGVLSISRPEAIIYAVAIFAGIFLVKMIKARKALPYMYVALGIVVAIVLVFVGLRYLYYGDFVPNTLYAKNSPGVTTFKSGIYYSILFVGLALCPFLIAALLKRPPILTAYTLPIYTVIVAQFAFVVYAGGDWMPSFRLFLPALPLLLFLIVDQIDVDVFVRKSVVAILVVVTTICATSWYVQRDYIKSNYQDYVSGLRLSFPTYDPDYYDMARALSEIASSGDSVLVAEAGLIPYFNSQLRFDDMYGLMNRHIAKDVQGDHFTRVDNDYFYANRYDYFVAVSRDPDPTSNSDEFKSEYYVVDAFLEDPRFSENYTPVYRSPIGIIYERMG